MKSGGGFRYELELVGALFDNRDLDGHDGLFEAKC